MRLWQIPRSVPGQFLIAFLGGVMIVGPTGCANTYLPVAVPTNPFGIMINSDASSNKLGVQRLADGRNLFVFGSFDESGWVREITGLVFVDAQGQRATISLENGLFKRATSPSGSTVEITYDEVSPLRLRGHVDLFFSEAPEPDQNQTIDFDIDLRQTAEDLVQMIRDEMGVDISDEAPPPDPLARARKADASARVIAEEMYGPPAPGAQQAKDQQRAQLFIFAIFHASAFAALGYGIVQLVGHIVRGVKSLIVGLVQTITHAIVLRVMTPFLILGEMLRLAVLNDVFTIDIDIDLDIDIPDPPG